MKTPKALAAAQPRKGEEILILCAGYWAKAPTVEAAIKALQWSLSTPWQAWSVPPSAWVNDDGQIVRDAGTPAPLLICRD